MGFLDSVGSLGASKLFGTDAKSLMESQHAFTQKMMQMKHQWEVKDLEAAGLNPILSAKNVTPLGSSGSASQALSSGNDITTAAQLKQMAKQNKQIESQEKLNKKVTKKTEEEAKISSAKARQETVSANIAEQRYNQLYGEGGKEAGISATSEDYPSAIRGPARDFARLGTKVLQKIQIESRKPTSASAVKRTLKKIDDWLKKYVDPVVLPKHKKVGKPASSNKEKADRYREFLKKNPRKIRTNKQKADSYREFLKKNPRR